MPAITAEQIQELKHVFNDLQVGKANYDSETGELQVSINDHITDRQLSNLLTYLEQKDLAYEKLPDGGGRLRFPKETTEYLGHHPKAFIVNYLNAQFENWEDILPSITQDRCSVARRLPGKGFLLKTTDSTVKLAYRRAHVSCLGDLGYKAVFFERPVQRLLNQESRSYEESIDKDFDPSDKITSKSFFEVILDFFRNLMGYSKQHKMDHLIPISPQTILVDPAQFQLALEAELSASASRRFNGPKLLSSLDRPKLSNVNIRGIGYGRVKCESSKLSDEVVEIIDKTRGVHQEIETKLGIEGFSEILDATLRICRINFYDTTHFKTKLEDIGVQNGRARGNGVDIDLPAHGLKEYIVGAFTHEALHQLEHSITRTMSRDEQQRLAKSGHAAQRCLTKFLADHDITYDNILMRYTDNVWVNPARRDERDPRKAHHHQGTDFASMSFGLLVSLRNNEAFVEAYNDPDNHELDDLKTFTNEFCSRISQNMSRTR